MRNPVRLKNFRGRYFVWFLLGVLVLLTSRPTPQSLGLGSLVLAAGVLLRGWGAGFLVKNDELTTAGPYAHLRHPLYAGTLLVGAGFAIGVGGWWTPAVLGLLAAWFFGAYFPRKDRVEGERLESRYGEDYARYRAAVPALWPRFPGFRAPAGATPDARPWSLSHYSQNNELGTVIAIAIGWLLLLWRLGQEAA